METQRVKAQRPYLVVILLMAAGVAALYAGRNVALADRPGVRMQLPPAVGAWTGYELRYCHDLSCGGEFRLDELKDPAICPRCGAPLHAMTKVERDVLPPDTTFVKGRYTAGDGSTLFVSIVLSGGDSGSIHRPQACLTGQGLQITRSRVERVPLPGRPPLAIMLLDLLRRPNASDPRGPDARRGLFAYWFVGQERETPYHLARLFWLYWDRLFRGVSHRWAYIAVLSESGGDPARTLGRIRDFVAAFHPQVVLAPPAPAAQ
jgi:hypothetical protein